MRFVVFLSLLAFVLTACGGSSVAERVASAEMAFAAEDVASSRRICDRIMGEDVSDGGVTATELCRLSILYMQLYDRTDDADALDLATRCYRSAFSENADSARYFYTHLAVDQDKYVMSLSTLVQSIDNPAGVDCDYEDTDSVLVADSVKNCK